jgi:hemolysin III
MTERSTMTEGSTRPRGEHSRGEEVANALSHGAALVAAAAVAPLLIVAAAGRGSVAGVVGASVFAATVLLLYLASTVYHAFPRRRTEVKKALEIADHAAIYLLIAGTYTPFALGALRGTTGWTMLGMVWGLALLGVAVKLLRGTRYPLLSVGLYVALGWIVLLWVRPVLSMVPAWGLAWLLAGGLAYTGGVGFFVAEGLRYGHLAWHLCVMAGTACHFVAVWRYAG